MHIDILERGWDQNLHPVVAGREVVAGLHEAYMKAPRLDPIDFLIFLVFISWEMPMPVWGYYPGRGGYRELIWGCMYGETKRHRSKVRFRLSICANHLLSKSPGVSPVRRTTLHAGYASVG